MAHPTPPEHLGLATLATRAFRGEALEPLARSLEARVRQDPGDAGAMLDLGLIRELLFHPKEGLAWQARALELKRVFRIPAQRREGLRLLMFVAPGEIMANVPVQFLLQDSDVRLDLAFVLPDHPLPAPLPDHDLAMVGIAESDENRPLLAALQAALQGWPRPVLLDPSRVPLLARDRLWRELEDGPGLRVPPTVRLLRGDLERLAGDRVPLGQLLPGGSYPLILRPTGSHAGRGLEKLDDPAALASYLAGSRADTYYLTTFVDYRSSDGFYRKYRVTLIEGRPFICHMALAPHWMLHYLNAGMVEHAERRAEEAKAFATFDQDFARRHATAFRHLHERLGLEYLGLDCGETPDGRLLVFEADTAMVVHAMDPADLFPYKPPQMARVFHAFRELLQRRAEGSRERP